MLGTALALGSLFLKGVSAFQQAQANRDLSDMIKSRESELNTQRTMLENQDFLNTKLGKSGLEAIRDAYKYAYQKSGQGNTIMGASDESRLASQAQLTEGLVDSTQKWAGNATDYQMEQEKLLVPQEEANRQQMLGLQANKGEAWGNVGDTAMNAFALSTMIGGEGEGSGGGGFSIKDLFKKGSKGTAPAGAAYPSLQTMYGGSIPKFKI